MKGSLAHTKFRVRLSNCALLSAFCVSFFVAIAVAYPVVEKRVLVKTLEIGDAQKGAAEILWNIDSISTAHGLKAVITGWSLEKNAYINAYNVNFVLRSSSGIFYQLPTQRISRPDVTAQLNENDRKYDFCGMRAAFYKRQLNSGTYELYILFKNNGRNILIETKKDVVIT